MNGLLALTVLCVIFAVGDIVSAKTKSILSMLFVSSVILLIGFWVGLPTTIFDDAALLKIGGILIAFLITHMGTLMSFKDLKAQWKTVVIAIGAVAGIGVFLFLVGPPLLGKEYAIAAAPPVSGGVVAAIMMGEAAKAKGLDSLAVFATLIVVVQGFFGFPVASILLGKEARKVRDEFRENGSVVESKVVSSGTSDVVLGEKPKLIPPFPAYLQTPYVLLAKLGIVAVIGFQLAHLLNDIINPNVMCLIVGVAAKELGFLEEDIMTKANAFGLAMVTLVAVIFSSLTQASPQMLATLVFPLVGSLLLGLVGILIVCSILGKILGYSKEMAISIGVSALFGFPGTFVISNEVAQAVGETEEEREVILDAILPKMLVAGFMTVTISSVILAGIMVNFM
ncbi:MAG: hypothetical protein GX329_06700 [Tissierellia bacterium]|nr:hypothetical protein [Tissierellia bacterium]